MFLRLRHLRSRVWKCFTVDRLLKPSKAAERLAPRLLAHLNEPLDFGAYMLNLALLQHWEEALEERERPGSMRWWNQQLRGSRDIPADVGQRYLVDDLDGVREKWKTAEKWKDLEDVEWDSDQF